MQRSNQIKSNGRRNRASKPSQLFSKSLPLIPPCTHARGLLARGIMSMEHEYIVRHGVDLRESYLILSRPQVWRNVKEVLLSLDKAS